MKISFLSVTIAVSIGVGLGFGAYQVKDRISDFLNRPRFAVVNLNSVVKANEVRSRLSRAEILFRIRSGRIP